MARTSARVRNVLKGLLCGFLSRLLFQQCYNIPTRIRDVNAAQCECAGCPLCPPTEVHIDRIDGVRAPYKPKGMYEVNRWLFFDDQYLYDIVNEEPKVKLEGHWKDEIDSAVQAGMEYVNGNRMLGQQWSLAELQGGYLKVDTTRGTDFILDLVAAPASGKTANELFRVHLVHPFQRIQKNEAPSIRKIEKEQKITIVVQVTQGFAFVDSLVDNVVSNSKHVNTRLLLVGLGGRTKKINETTLKMKTQNSAVEISLVEEETSFLKALHKIALSEPESLILSIKEDMAITEQLLWHCELLARRDKQVYFPIAYAQYDSDIIEKGMPPGKPKNIDRKKHSKFTGFWDHSNRGSLCAYGSDWVEVLTRAGRFHDAFTSSFEDRLYEKFLRRDYNVITAVEPNLYSVNYKQQCEPYKADRTKHKQCLLRKAKYHGSKMALGILFIKKDKGKER